jgi:hypothetical protein
MSKKPKYDLILFILLMVLGFLPMLQGWFHFFPMKPLNGVTEEMEKPKISFTSYLSGDYARQAEAYTSQNIGFREPIIRLYNQYLWGCYHKTYAHDVMAGKKNWLYYPQSVRDYYGKELLRWHSSTDEAKGEFDQEIKYLNWARSILNENGVELLVFMAPEKSFLYPEYLPNGEKDTTTFNACDYFAQRFEETGFPYIEMTRWFQQIKDTVDYPLIPQAGAHWIFPSVYAVDSLSRLMGELKDISLPRIIIGEAYETRKRNHDYDNDLEQLLNLAFPIRHQFGYYPRHRVGIKQDSTSVKPKVLFIGNSYFWAMNLFVPLQEMFENVEYWYYFSTVYSGENLTQTDIVNRLDIVEKYLNFDYVVWFTTGNQMNKGTAGFAGTTILNLCYSKDEISSTYNHIIDSLRYDSLTLVALDPPLSDSNYKQLLWPIANNLVCSHPERYFPELASDTLPIIRNPRIKEVLAINEIKKDSVWMWNLSTCQTVIQNVSLEQVLLMEAHNIIEGKPLMRDMPNVEAKRDRVEQLVVDIVKEIQSKPELMRQIEEKALKNGISVEKQTVFDARWIVNDLIKKNYFSLETP